MSTTKVAGILLAAALLTACGTQGQNLPAAASPSPSVSMMVCIDGVTFVNLYDRTDLCPTATPTPQPTTATPTPTPTPEPTEESVPVLSRDAFFKAALEAELVTVTASQPRYVRNAATKPLPLAYARAERIRECKAFNASSPPKHAYTDAQRIARKYHVSEFVGGFVSVGTIVQFPDQALFEEYGFGGQPYATTDDLCADVKS